MCDDFVQELKKCLVGNIKMKNCKGRIAKEELPAAVYKWTLMDLEIL
jgi:hypothetical protein